MARRFQLGYKCALRRACSHKQYCIYDEYLPACLATPVPRLLTGAPSGLGCSLWRFGFVGRWFLFREGLVSHRLLATCGGRIKK
jgi:hypothetical protein